MRREPAGSPKQQGRPVAILAQVIQGGSMDLLALALGECEGSSSDPLSLSLARHDCQWDSFGAQNLKLLHRRMHRESAKHGQDHRQS